MNEFMRNTFLVKLFNGRNQSMEYKLWAIMQHDGKQYLVMKAEQNPLLAEDLMLLAVEQDESGSVYTVVKDLAPFAQALEHTLGVNTSIH